MSRLLVAGLLSAAFIWLHALISPSPAHIKNSGTVVTPQIAESVKQPRSNAEQVTKPAEPVATVVENPKPELSGVEPEKQQEEPKPVVEQLPPVNTAEDEAKAFIYHVESTTNPSAENYLGCYGLGQDCNGIVKEKCGADYNCQDAFFTDYMKRRYGTWQEAKAFWLARVPINGKDVGHWW